MTPSPVRTPLTRIIHDSASGFVLVGVIMFILVLTILGLSLFSLSGFEAQFFNASLHRQDAYYIATGGIERAKWVLMKTGSLDKVKESLPEGMDSTEARQGEEWDTAKQAGNITWNDPKKPVWIRALAESHGVKSCVEARFMPVESKGIYTRLITSYTGVTVVPSQSDVGAGGDGIDDPTRWKQTWLTGEVWQNDADTSWTQVPVNGAHPVMLGDVPAPDVSGFIAAHLAGAVEATPGPDTSPWKGTPIYIDLLGTPGGDPVYYRTSTHLSNEDEGRDFYGANRFEVHVRGTVVWLLPAGIDIRCKVELKGPGETSPTPDDRLIIVASKGGGKRPDAGISLDNFDSKAVPFFLVSDAQVDLSHEWQYHDGETASSYLSIFAGSVNLMGPEYGITTQNKQHLTHDSSRDSDVLGPLYEAAALPNASARDRSLAAIPGTWRQMPTGGLN